VTSTYVKPFPRIVLAIAWVLHRILLRWTVTGTENVPAEGGCIVVANHVHLADPVLLLLSLPRWITFMAKEELFRNAILGRLLRDAGIFAVARAGNVQQKRDVMRQAEELLAAGRVLALFPEGSRSRSGVMQAGKGGAAILAIHAGVPVLPVAIDGTEQLYRAGWWLRRPRVTVTVGAPFRLQTSAERMPRSELSRLTDELMHHIAERLPEKRRGPYAS